MLHRDNDRPGGKTLRRGFYRTERLPGLYRVVRRQNRLQHFLHGRHDRRDRHFRRGIAPARRKPRTRRKLSRTRRARPRPRPCTRIRLGSDAPPHRIRLHPRNTPLRRWIRLSLHPPGPGCPPRRRRSGRMAPACRQPGLVRRTELGVETADLCRRVDLGPGIGTEHGILARARTDHAAAL